MSLAASAPAPLPATGRRGIPPLPLLTLLNYFNYMDRQVVYGMTDKISDAFHLSAGQLNATATQIVGRFR